MSRIEEHVEALFAKYRPTQQIVELKEEIHSNLTAKVQDLQAEGMAEEDAAAVAIRHLHSIDHLIDGNHKVYKFDFCKQLTQIAWLYAAIAWVISIPLGLVSRAATHITFFLPIVIVLLAVLYGVFSGLAKDRDRNLAIYMSQSTVRRWRRIVWFIWALFVLVATLSVTAVNFGSDIWFGRPMTISGPYEFGVITAQYVLPWLSILLPMLIHQVERLLQQEERHVGDDDE